MNDYPVVLKCVRVSKAFEAIRALDNVSFALSNSSVVAVVGPNGAGKTTLFDVISGFVLADTGMCLLRGTELRGLSASKVARLGVARTFQEVRIVGRLTALDNVMLAHPNQRGESLFGALFRRKWGPEERYNRRVAEDMLGSVGLTNEMNKVASELSFGQRKLLSVAVVRATNASVMLLDEPVAGIHPKRRTGMIALIAQLRSEGKLVVFIEHDMAAVREIADKVILMREGRILADGKPGEVLERHRLREAYLD